MKQAVVVAAVAAVLVASCTPDPHRGSSGGGPTSSSVTTTASPSSGGSGPPSTAALSGMGTADASNPVRAAALAVAARELQAYLDSWRSTGLANASHRYLAPDEQVAPPWAQRVRRLGPRRPSP